MGMKVLVLICVLSSALAQEDDPFLYDTFPEGFYWGVASSAYQIEGSIDVDGKGRNIWDVWTHENNGENILDGSNGDVACDSYNKFLQDIAALKAMGADFYRFSIAWTRIIPTGFYNGTVNQAGVDYYNRVIDAVVQNGMFPLVTIYCWDLPQPLQDIGGFPNEGLIPEYGNYARVLFREYGDRVKHWITFNEPFVICQLGYAYGTMAPGIVDPAEKPYQCAHTIIKAHGLAYRIYENEFKDQQQGRVGITLDSSWNAPLDPSNPDHLDASDRAMRFTLGWVANPLLRGEYPAIMRELVDRKSALEGRNTSRLPSFDPEWTKIINGSLDFVGLNTYTTNYVYPTEGGPPGRDGDCNIGEAWDPEWEDTAADWLKIVPWGMRKLVGWITKEYDRPEIWITENGCVDRDVDGLEDAQRVRYFRDYINQLLKAVKVDGADVRAYTAWTLIDNFEWAAGYTQRFGLHYVNFSDPNLSRVRKESAVYLTDVFAANGFPNQSFTQLNY